MADITLLDADDRVMPRDLVSEIADEADDNAARQACG